MKKVSALAENTCILIKRKRACLVCCNDVHVLFIRNHFSGGSRRKSDRGGLGVVAVVGVVRMEVGFVQ